MPPTKEGIGISPRSTHQNTCTNTATAIYPRRPIVCTALRVCSSNAKRRKREKEREKVDYCLTVWIPLLLLLLSYLATDEKQSIEEGDEKEEEEEECHHFLSPFLSSLPLLFPRSATNQ